MNATAGLLVALGAALGAPTRYLAGHLLDGARLHWGTLAVNLAGSFLLGLLGGMAVTGDAMALLGTGFCGGLTTYSSFALQAVGRGPRVGALYVVATVGGGLALAALGWALA